MISFSALTERMAFSVSTFSSSMIFLIEVADSLDWDASELISPATTAKPLPASPALAASMDALRERRLVWPAMESMTFAASITVSTEVPTVLISFVTISSSSMERFMEPISTSNLSDTCLEFSSISRVRPSASLTVFSMSESLSAIPARSEDALVTSCA